MTTSYWSLCHFSQFPFREGLYVKVLSCWIILYFQPLRVKNDYFKMLFPSWNHTFNNLLLLCGLMTRIYSRDSRKWWGWIRVFVLTCALLHKWIWGFKEWSLLIGKQRLSHGWLLGSTLWVSFNLRTSRRLRCLHDDFMGPIWHNYGKIWVKILNYLMKVT